MSKTTKIVIGVVVVVVVIVAGYVYLDNSNAANQGVIMGPRNSYDATHLLRTLQSGGTPGDGGGG